MKFRDVAIYCETTYGIQYDRDEEFFICPECGEPIYFEDWDGVGENWETCPICDFSFMEGDNE